ncbi:hypothetical protein KC316_g3369, partial [Hortaea werneckii]
PTFDATNTPAHLGLSMLCLAYQFGEDPDAQRADESGARFALQCFHRARRLAAAEENSLEGKPIAARMLLIQTYWILAVCAMMYLCGKASCYGLKLRTRMVDLARDGGLTQSVSNNHEWTEDLDDLWRNFIQTESLKRTLFAVHQLDTVWYHLLSIPRSLSHLELKLDLPCCDDDWRASSSAQWAHRRLITGQSASTVTYAEAVRQVMAANPDLGSIQQSDLYGLINVIHFIHSSLREVSGWSTMSGRVSLDRIEPLRIALNALEPLVRPSTSMARPSSYAILCEATWEMAMIELQLWSASHTFGLVERSLDSALHHSTHLASTCETLFEDGTANAVQPHVNWFLRYLDQTTDVSSECPWLASYAYKAFLIAWQLVRKGRTGAMAVVDVQDGDLTGAVEWAQDKCRRRERRHLGKGILDCLDQLHLSA